MPVWPCARWRCPCVAVGTLHAALARGYLTWVVPGLLLLRTHACPYYEQGCGQEWGAGPGLRLRAFPKGLRRLELPQERQETAGWAPSPVSQGRQVCRSVGHLQTNPERPCFPVHVHRRGSHGLCTRISRVKSLPLLSQLLIGVLEAPEARPSSGCGCREHLPVTMCLNFLQGVPWLARLFPGTCLCR